MLGRKIERSASRRYKDRVDGDSPEAGDDLLPDDWHRVCLRRHLRPPFDIEPESPREHRPEIVERDLVPILQRPLAQCTKPMVQLPLANILAPVPQRRSRLQLIAVQDRRTQPPQPRAALVRAGARDAHPLVEDRAKRAPAVVRENRACVHAAFQVILGQVLDCPVRARPPVEEVAAQRAAPVKCAGEHGRRVGQPGEDNRPDSVYGLYGDLGRVRVLEAVEVAREVARVLQARERLGLDVFDPIFVRETRDCERFFESDDGLVFAQIEAAADESAL